MASLRSNSKRHASLHRMLKFLWSFFLNNTIFDANTVHCHTLHIHQLRCVLIYKFVKKHITVTQNFLREFFFSLYDHNAPLNLVNIPVYLATPLNVMSSIIVGSERPFALTANKTIRYELPGSRLSI